MSNTVEYRARSASRYTLTKNQENTNREIENRKKAMIKKEIFKQYPQITENKKKYQDVINTSRDVLLNSYIGNKSKIFSKFLLWPFVPRLKDSEKVNAWARFLLFITAILASLMTLAKILPASIPGFQFFLVPAGNLNTFIAIVSLILPNYVYHLTQKIRFQKKVNEAQDILDRDAEIVKREMLRCDPRLPTGNEKYFEHNSAIASERLLREPLRQPHSIGGHPGITGIM